MTQDWDGGYIADIGYTHDYFFDMSPAHIGLALLLSGYAAPDHTRPFAYCELGCGQGLTTNVLAAANPTGAFWANDFNPAHINNAQALAMAAGSGNVTFLDHDFAAMAKADLPQFDFIALHGIWSWVNEAARQAVLAFIAQRLRVGGVVYVSYNALPGWAAAMPLREVMQHYGRGETSQQRVAAGQQIAARLEALGGAAFAENPAMGAKLKSLAGKPVAYLAHEYFNAVFAPSYFREVAASMGFAKLGYAASSHLRDNEDGLNFNAEAQALLAEFAQPVAREGMRDFLTNRQFRRDIFIRGPRRLTPGAQTEALLRQRLALVAPDPDTLALVMKLPGGEVNLKPGVYRPILQALARRPMRVAELLAEPAIAALGQPIVLEAVRMLCVMHAVMAALPEEGEAERRASTERFNAAVMGLARHADGLRTLASPVLGGGVAANRFDQLFLLAAAQGRPPVDVAWQALQAQGQRVAQGGNSLQGEAENRAALTTIHGEFAHQRLPALRRLGVA